MYSNLSLGSADQQICISQICIFQICISFRLMNWQPFPSPPHMLAQGEKIGMGTTVFDSSEPPPVDANEQRPSGAGDARIGQLIDGILL